MYTSAIATDLWGCQRRVHVYHETNVAGRLAVNGSSPVVFFPMRSRAYVAPITHF